jgi:hypothetical protein
MLDTMKLRTKIFLAVATVLSAAILFWKDGPYGPPIFTDAVGGYFTIDAAIWFASDEDAIAHANYACLTRYFNASAAKIEITAPKYTMIGGTIRLQFLPRWITVYCSP